MNKKKLFIILPLLLLVLAFSACFGSAEDSSNINLFKGQAYDFYQGEGYEYFSSNQAVATVSENGLIIAVDVGSSVVTASNKEKSKLLKVTVKESELGDVFATISLDGGSISDYNWVLSNGDYVSFEECAFPAVEKTGYDFVGWISGGEYFLAPEQGGNYVAVWSEKEFTVTYELNGGINGDNPSTYKYFDGDLSLKDAHKDYAVFLGWYFDEDYQQKAEKLVNKGEDYVLYALFKDYSASIDVSGGTFNSDDWTKAGDIYVCFELTDFPSVEKVGYDFVGWKSGSAYFNEPQYHGHYVAEFKEKEFNIEYVLNGGTNGNNPSIYKYFDEDVVLEDAEYANHLFMGWYTDAEFNTKVTKIVNNKQNWKVYAYFVEGYTVTEYLNGEFYQNELIGLGNSFNEPAITQEGYFVIWYSDENCTSEYDFTLPLSGDIAIYGVSYKELTKSFFGYTNNKLTEVNNLEEMQYFLEYVFFNEFTTGKEVKVNFDFSEYLDDSTKMSNLLNKSTCPFISVSYGSRKVGTKQYFSVSVSTEIPTTFYTYTSPNAINQYKTFDYYVDQGFTSSRNSDFNDFAYYSFDEQVSVKNSNQLFFALEHRVVPVPIAGSNAEIALNKCKEILREICDDSMTDEQKVRAIYKYLIMNVDYVLPENVTDDLSYDAFYMEGILNNGAGVCDGISKTFSALCNIEGIRCVRTASDSHAWNEVFINGKWFTIDATHGNLINGNKEYLTFENYLINETLKEGLGYADILRTEIIADGVYDFYTETEFEYDGATYDFNATSTNEIAIIMKYGVGVASADSLTTFTLDFAVDYDYGMSFDDDFSSAKMSSGLSIRYTIQQYMHNRGDKSVVILVFTRK